MSSTSRRDQYLKELLEIKQRIEASEKGTKEFQDTLEHYQYRVDLIPFLGDAIVPPEYELEEDMMPRDYLEYRNNYMKGRPYRFLDWLNRNSTVALVKVKKVRRRGAEVTVCPLHIFKGSMSEVCVLSVPTFWEKDIATDWFKKSETSLLIFSGGMVGLGSNTYSRIRRVSMPFPGETTLLSNGNV